MYFLHEGPSSGRGRRKKCGAKVDYRCLPERYRQSVSLEEAIETAIYQMPIARVTESGGVNHAVNTTY